MVLGPSGSYYAGNKYQIDVDIPDQYPKVPLECYIKQKICHVNVEQGDPNPKGYRILFKNLKEANWKQNFQIFQIICQIVKLL